MFRKVLAWLGCAAAIVMASPMLAMAQQGAAGGGGEGLRSGLIALGAGLAIGVAALGCGLGQGRLAASAMESLGRNPNSEPQIRTWMIVGLAFVESLSLYALLIAYIMQGKI
ncbi:MAG TPA: ATP synthase F0 subunit C [Candidatus Binataceae bacterium]|jgi:F-type H+-transporting ATPase subunit c|nr:ATP synthase F0 subunit C [Candidatus Binataceae bacterium]